MLLDSNILIYAAQPQHAELREFIAEHAPAVSVITHIEVLGYHKLRDVERTRFEEFFRAAEDVFPLSDGVVDQEIKLRQQRKISLGDSIIAATSLVHDRILVTHNINDFTWIENLSLLDPLREQA